MCIFSSQLANICAWAGTPAVPYWLPAVTQEDGEMEDWEGERREIKGVVMMWGHEPRGFLPLLFLICLSDDNKTHGGSKRREVDIRKGGGGGTEEKERQDGGWNGRKTTFFKLEKQAGYNIEIPKA